MDNPKVKLLNINMPLKPHERKFALSNCVERLLQWMYEMNKLNEWDSENFIIKTSSDEFGEVNGIYFEMTDKGIPKTWN